MGFFSDQACTNKTCTKCKKLLNLLEFNKRKRAKDGLTFWCKKCNGEYSKKYNLDHQKQRFLTYKKRQEVLKLDIKKLEKFRFKRAVYARKYRKENPEYFRNIWSNKKHKRRALERNSFGTFTSKEITNQLASQNNRCFYCKIEIKENSMHRDHYIPLSKGGNNTISNIVCTCPTCNTRKGNKMPDQFIKEISQCHG